MEGKKFNSVTKVTTVNSNQSLLLTDQNGNVTSIGMMRSRLTLLLVSMPGAEECGTPQTQRLRLHHTLAHLNC